MSLPSAIRRDISVFDVHSCFRQHSKDPNKSKNVFAAQSRSTIHVIRPSQRSFQVPFSSVEDFVLPPRPYFSFDDVGIAITDLYTASVASRSVDHEHPLSNWHAGSYQVVEVVPRPAVDRLRLLHESASLTQSSVSR